MAIVRKSYDWAGIMPDILANIFCRLSLRERLCNISKVCRQWKFAVEIPECWQVVDLTCCLNRKTSIQKAQALLQLILNRSQGLLTHLTYPFFMDNESLALIAYRAPLLEMLHMPNSISVTDDWVVGIAPKLRSMAELDISGCSGLSHVGLEALGMNCRNITHLRRNRNFFYTHHPYDEEAFVIAQHFPHLQHLEVANTPFSTRGLRAILDSCVALTSLDLRGNCQHLEMSEAFIMECKQRLSVFLEPGDESFLMFDLQGPDDAMYYRQRYRQREIPSG